MSHSISSSMEAGSSMCSNGAAPVRGDPRAFGFRPWVPPGSALAPLANRPAAPARARMNPVNAVPRDPAYIVVRRWLWVPERAAPSASVPRGHAWGNVCGHVVCGRVGLFLGFLWPPCGSCAWVVRAVPLRLLGYCGVHLSQRGPKGALRAGGEDTS